MDPFEVDSMQECMERCSRYWGDSEGCYGIVWREDKQCWLRNSTTSTASLVNDTGIHSALVEAGDMNALDESCPAADLSVNDLPGVEGIGYTVHCGKVIGDYDTCWNDYPECLPSPFTGFWHATSLVQCLRICIREHPLCRAVSYNPGLEIGFANCWPKTGFPQTLDDPPSSQGTMHSATITSIETIDTECPADSSYTASGSNKQFEIHCGQLNTGTNITAVHKQNVTACMDACANRKNCVGVLFDSSLQGGYQNCYLQNTTSVISDQSSATYAVLSGSGAPTSPNPDDNSSSSKAWIAGPVVGGLAGIAALVGAFFLVRRWRTKNAAGAGIAEKDANSYTPAPAYTPVAQGHEHRAPPSELGGDYAREMPAEGAKPTVKYAQGAGGAEPQELPS